MMNQTHLSTSDYDRLLLHALSGEERARCEEHLVACERCRADHAGYAADARRFSEEILPRAMARLPVRPRGSLRARLPRPALWFLAPAMTAALVLLAVRARLADDGHGTAPMGTADDLRIKGGEPSLRAFARRMQQVFPVKDGSELHPGDELRFVVDSPRLPFLLLASLDGAGRVNVYFPYDGSQSGAIAVGKPTELPGSIVLDSAPGPERVFALYSSQPLRRADVEPALKSLWASGAQAVRTSTVLPVGAEQQITFRFEKAAP